MIKKSVKKSQLKSRNMPEEKKQARAQIFRYFRYKNRNKTPHPTEKA